MKTETGLEAPPDVLRLADLRPYFVITVLECVDDDPDGAFVVLQQFLRCLVDDPGRSLSVRVTSEITIGGGAGTESVDDAALLEAHGFDRLYGVTRERVVRPEWVTNDSPIADIINELVLALRRGRLVAVRTHNKRTLLKWVNSGASPYRRIPVDVMAATFDGDGKALWLNGVHRRRVTKPDGKALYGLRLQEATNVLEDATFAMSAMKLHVVPEDVSIQGGS